MRQINLDFKPEISLFQKKIQGIKNTEQFPSATIDFSSKQHIIEDKEVALQIWDTPGSEK